METSSELRISPTRGAMTVGAVVAGIMLILSSFGFQLLSWIAFIGGIYYGMRIYRKALGGIVSYPKVLNVGFQTAFFASLILAFFTYLSTKTNSSLIPSMIDTYEEKMKTSDMPVEMIEYVVQLYRKMLSPLTFAGITILMYSVIGGILSAILALFVRNNKTVSL